MDLQNQQRVIDAAKKYGAENVIVLLGSSDAEGAGLYAETVTAGDPTYAGPLAGVSLGLPVYHVFDEAIKAEADPGCLGRADRHDGNGARHRKIGRFRGQDARPAQQEQAVMATSGDRF